MVPVSPTPPEGSADPAPDPRAFVDRVRLLCRRETAFDPTQDALVMVSGGQDSLALLHLLVTGVLRGDGPDRVRALHVNHHLRGAESEADEALVRDHCSALGVPLDVYDAAIDKSDGNVQAEARAARRVAALEISARTGIRRVVLGHTLDDQVETMLYRLGRYAGLAALAAMPPVDPPWVRPLLTSRRLDTRAYCESANMAFAVDRGNEYPGYARTGLRGMVIPAWEQVLPGAVQSAGKAAEVAAEALAIVRGAVEEAETAVSLSPEPSAYGRVGADIGPAGRDLSARGLLRLERPLRRAVLRSFLEQGVGREISRAVVLEVEALLDVEGSAERAVGGDWVAVREYDRLSLLPGMPRRSGGGHGRDGRDGDAPGADVNVPSEADSHPSGRSLLSDRPGEAPGEVRVGGLVVRSRPAEHLRAHDPRTETYLDAGALGGGLWVRLIRPGDRMRPLGSPGRRLLHDILADLKIPRSLRARVPVVGCGECIVWLAGFAVAEEGRIGPTTRRLIHLTVQPAGNENRDAPPGFGAESI